MGRQNREVGRPSVFPFFSVIVRSYCFQFSMKILLSDFDLYLRSQVNLPVCVCACFLAR